LVFSPAVALAAPSMHMMEVKIMDKVVGKMNVTGYDAMNDGGLAKSSITGNFVKKNNAGLAISAEAEQLLKDKFPLGLTYMQTVMFMFDSGKQQKNFRDKDGNDLKGTFSDPPQGGYKLRSGTVEDFGMDMPLVFRHYTAGYTWDGPGKFFWDKPIQ
jgi:hypothetical protein